MWLGVLEPVGQEIAAAGGLADVCVFDLLTDRIESVALLSGRAQEPWFAGAWRPLGMADERRVLIARRQGATATVCVGDLAGGPLASIFGWPDDMDLAPFLAQMPADYWH